MSLKKTTSTKKQKTKKVLKSKKKIPVKKTVKKKPSTKKTTKKKSSVKRTVKKKAAIKRKVNKKPSVKKTVKKKTLVSKKSKEKLIGKVVHYFDKVKVAVIKLNYPLAVDEKIKIKGGETDFEQKVKSMEIDKEKIKKAKNKQEVGIKVNEKAREGYRVYKISP